MRNKKGFTLIELIVVIAILAVLAAIAVPSYSAFLEHSRKAADEANVQALNSATRLYATDELKLTTEIFSGVSSDSDKIDLLISNGYIDSSPVPEQDDVVFLFSTENGLWTLSASGQELSAFSVALQSSLIDYSEFMSKKSKWSFGSSTKYDVSTWSGYLEKLLEKGTGSVFREDDDTGTNSIEYTNPVSGKTSVFNWSDWDGIKNSSAYSSYMPPAILITNDSDLAPGSSYITSNLNTLKGSMIIYKSDSQDVSETVVYYVYEDGSTSVPQPLGEVLS